MYNLLRLFHCAIIIALFCFAPYTLSQDQQVSAFSQSIQQVIDAYHEGVESNQETLKIVYFYPNDVEPQRNYQVRLTRIMMDVQNFFRAEMQRNGFGPKTFPLEMEGELVKIYLVKGQERSESYGHNFKYGGMIRTEIQQALKGEVDLNRDYVLVFGGMSLKQKNGEYYFYAPYYGWPPLVHDRGLAFVADGEILDTDYTSTELIRYKEVRGGFTKTVGEFNRLYIGGIAHELGHGLGLHHKGQSPIQKQVLGTALMGMGNHTFRDEVAGNKVGTFLSFSSAVQLAVHPLFTQSDKNRYQPMQFNLSNIATKLKDNELGIKATIESSQQAVAVIVSSDPLGRGGYDAQTWVAPIVDGKFKTFIDHYQDGKHELGFSVVFANGAVFHNRKIPYMVNSSLQPNVDDLIANFPINDAVTAYLKGDKERAAELSRSGLTNKSLNNLSAAKLEHLIKLVESSELVNLAAASDDTVYLSDAKWQSAAVGWGEPVRDQYFNVNNHPNEVFLSLNDKFFANGLYAHSPSQYVFNLDRRWKNFEAIVGLQSGAHDSGSGVFIIKGDGKELYRSERLSGNDTEKIAVDIKNVEQLELIVESGKSNNFSCWTVWGEPLVSR